jgi:uncharacterized RDD family membrane protein YckC
VASLEAAPIGLRLIAGLIDLLTVTILVVVALMVAAALMSVIDPDPRWAGPVTWVIALAVWTGYFTALERRGTHDRPQRGTLGKGVCRLAVVGPDGAPLGAARLALRALAKLALIPGLLLVPIGGRALHDRLTGSRVSASRPVP